MNRNWIRLAVMLGLFLPLAASALESGQAASGVKEALAKGVESAITQLGQTDGFLKDEVVRIALPGNLSKIADAARKFGQGKYVDRLETAMNRAAETAVPAAAEVLGDAIRTMSVRDAIGIVSGGEHAATDYFRESSGDALKQRLLPIVAESTASSGVAKAYRRLLDKSGGLASMMGGGSGDAVDLDSYVTDKTLDGLFHYIGQREADIRKNPLQSGSSLLKTVFGG